MQPVQQFLKADSGAASFMSFFLILTLMMVGGFAIDVQNLMAARTRLQATVDSAAHAALLARENMSALEAAQVAVSVATANMSSDRYGAVVKEDDVNFGVWDPETGSFSVNANSRSAVSVTASQVDERNNPVPTYLLKILGIDDWQLTRNAIFYTYYPSCLREGFVANGVVDLQSNNTYTNGFCIHSNEYVSLNSNNTFEPGTVVSMSDLSDIELPNSGYKTNEGLEESLREGSWNIRIVSRIPQLISRLENLDPEVKPDYITGTFRTFPDNRVSVDEIDVGAAYKYNCSGGGNQTLYFENSLQITKNLIITNCKISYGSGVVVQDAVIVSKNTASNSHSASAGLVLGKDDNCAPGGGAQLVTLGGMKFASDLHLFGSQLLAVGDIEFSANANGVEGAAMVAGGTISGTSNMDMSFCGTGMENNFHAAYFKLGQ